MTAMLTSDQACSTAEGLRSVQILTDLAAMGICQHRPVKMLPQARASAPAAMANELAHKVCSRQHVPDSNGDRIFALRAN